MKYLVKLADLDLTDIEEVLNKSLHFKYSKSNFQPFKTKTLALLFEKRSTRTRLSAEVGWSKMGGTSLFLGKDDIQMGVNETVKDSILVMSRMADCILARVNDHTTIQELVKYSRVPVINGLCNKWHPLQILADLLTMKEALDPQNNVTIQDALRGVKVTWVGDINNVINELMTTLPRFGMQLTVCHPPEYPLDKDVLKIAAKFCKQVNMDGGYGDFDQDIVGDDENGGSLTLTYDVKKSLIGARFVITDTWISMGQEDEKLVRLEKFKNYRITKELLLNSGVSEEYQFLHCLPRKQEEVDDDVFYSDRSLVWEEAENRLHTVKGVFSLVMS